MQLRFLGHAAFDLTLGGVRFCLDPHQPGALGGRFQLPEIVGPFDAIVHTHRHEDHSGWTPQLGTTTVIDQPTTVRDVVIATRAAFHDAQFGARMGLVRMVSLTAEGMRVVHCGDIGWFDDADVQWLRGADVLLVPVGGTYTLHPPQAVRLAHQVGARVVVPMHGADPHVDLPLRPVSEFAQLWTGPVVHAGALTTQTLAQLVSGTALILAAP